MVFQVPVEQTKGEVVIIPMDVSETSKNLMRFAN